MSRVVFLFDSSPLSVLTNTKYPQVTVDAIQWSRDLMHSGTKIIVPAIADFELRRELTRTRSVNSLTALDKFNGSVTDRYLALTDSALKRAAVLWALARNRGVLPADPKRAQWRCIDCGASSGISSLHMGIATSDLVIDTVNSGHLSLFVPAALWSDIKV